MARASRFSIFIFFTFSSFYSGFSFAAGNSEIVFSDEIRTAFYERAPHSLGTKMSNGVISFCASSNKAIELHVKSWLCAKNKLNYFRSVYVTGSKGPHGLICEASGSSFFKYLGTDLLEQVTEEGSCVVAEFDGEKYELVIQESSEEKNT
jgi:hypothetical protein